MQMSFLNADGTLNVAQLIADASKGGGSKLPDGVYTCRLLSAEIQDARGPEKGSTLPGKKTLNAKFTIMAGEHEKEELYLSYTLFNKSDKVGSTSGTVRFFSDLAAIGEGYVDGKSVKITFDTNGNMAVITKTGPSVEALKKFWMTAFAGKFVNISSETQTGTDKATKREFTYGLRSVVGIAGAVATAQDELPDDVPEDDEIPF